MPAMFCVFGSIRFDAVGLIQSDSFRFDWTWSDSLRFELIPWARFDSPFDSVRFDAVLLNWMRLDVTRFDLILLDWSRSASIRFVHGDLLISFPSVQYLSLVCSIFPECKAPLFPSPPPPPPHLRIPWNRFAWILFACIRFAWNGIFSIRFAWILFDWTRLDSVRFA